MMDAGQETLDTAAERLAYAVRSMLDCARQGAEPELVLRHFSGSLHVLAEDVRRRRDDATGARRGVLPVYFKEGTVKLVDDVGLRLHIAQLPKLDPSFEEGRLSAVMPTSEERVFYRQRVHDRTGRYVNFYLEQER